MEIKIKQVELKKFKFEHRCMSRLKALSGNSGPSRLHIGLPIQRILNKNSNSFRELYIEILNEDIKSIFIGEHGLENPEASTLKTRFAFFDYQKSIARNGKNSNLH